MKYIATIEGKEYTIEIIDEKRLRIGDREVPVDFVTVSGQPVFSLILDGKSYESFVYPGEDGAWQVHGNYLIHDGPDDPMTQVYVTAGCIEGYRHVPVDFIDTPATASAQSLL